MSYQFSVAADKMTAAYTQFAALPCIISAFMKLTTISVSQTVCDIGTSTTSRYSCRVSINNNVAAHHHDGTLSAATDSSTGPLADGLWHLCTAALTATNARAAYQDGTNKGTNSGVRTLITPSNIWIGQDAAGANQVKGKMAHLALWSVTPTDADILRLAFGPPDLTIPTGLVDYWRMNVNSASQISSTPLGTILTVTGAVWSSDDPAIPAGSGRVGSYIGVMP